MVKSSVKPKSHPKVVAKKNTMKKKVNGGNFIGKDTKHRTGKPNKFALQRIAAKKEQQCLKNMVPNNLEVKKAIEGVRTLENQLHEEKVKDLLGDEGEDGLIYMQVGMVKVANLLPLKHVVRPVRIRVHLPHSVVNSDTEVLLITRDEDNKKKRHLRQDFSENLNKFQEMLRMCGASKHINEVLTLRQLKVEFKEYEAKRHLANRVDLVLVDDTIIRRIPLFLGKHFYKRRKFPIQVNLKAKNLLAEIEKALTQQVLWLPMTGNSAIMTIGRLNQTNEMIEANIKATLQKFQEKFPGGWGNIQSLSLKTMRSKAVPLFANFSTVNEIESVAPKPLFARDPVVGEVNTYFGKAVKVNPDGTFKEITKKQLRRKERKMALAAGKVSPKKKKTAKEGKDSKLRVKKEPLISSKKKKALQESSEVPKKKLKVSDTPMKEEVKTGSKYDSMDVEDLDKMEMEYLKRISMKKEVEKKGGKSTTKTVPNEDSDDAWAEFSDEDILSDYYDDELQF